MQVTGYMLREALRRAITRRDLYAKQFKEHLFAFPGESKSAEAMADRYMAADTAVGILQDAQQRYNQDVGVTIGGRTLTLSLAVKMISGASRLASMWKEAINDTGRGRYDTDGRTSKSIENVYADRTVSVEQAMKRAEEADHIVSDLRTAMAQANTSERNFEGLNPELFE